MDGTCLCIECVPLFFVDNRLIKRPGRHGNESFFRRHGLAPVYWFRRSNGSMFFLC